MNSNIIFFSYSRVDSAFAIKLAKDLSASGYNAWLDQVEITPGNHWDSEIEIALDKAECMIVILSNSSVASNNVMDEVSYALENNKRIIPVLLNSCKIPFRLRRLHYISFNEQYENSFSKLLLALTPSTDFSPQTPFDDTQETEPIKVIDKTGIEHPTERDENHLWEEACRVDSIFSYIKYLNKSKKLKYENLAHQKIALNSGVNNFESRISLLNLPGTFTIPESCLQFYKDYGELKNIISFTGFQFDYKGGILNGKPHGYGFAKYLSCRYLGEWENSKMHGKGTYFFEKHKIIGNWENDKLLKKVTIVWDNGNKYTGDLKDYKMNGYGIFSWKNGNEYSGEFKNNKIEGNGTQTWFSGDKYTGEWVNWEMSGKGKLTLANGDEYSGEFKNHKRHGSGIFKWINGNECSGEWGDDQMSGKGTMLFNGGTYTGEFNNGHFNGIGEMNATPGFEIPNCPLCMKYIGFFINDKKSGVGKCFDVYGKLIYEGNFENDKPTDIYPKPK